MRPLRPQHSGLTTTDPKLGHETRDVNMTGVVAFLLFLTFGGIVIFAFLYGVFNFASNYALKQDEKDLRDPWLRKGEQQVEARAKEMRRPINQAKEPASMELADAESRSRVERFPQPRLQTDDVRDMAVLRQAEEAYLNNYFWIDKNAGKVNIPIDRAMQIIVEKGLPAMAPVPGTRMPQPAQSTGMVRPSIESSHAQKVGGVVK